jgi:hypothetical protein
MDWKLVKREMLRNPDVALEYAAMKDEDEAARTIIDASLKNVRRLLPLPRGARRAPR